MGLTKLIIKFLGREANVSEMNTLADELLKGKSIERLGNLVRIHYLISLTMAEYNVERAKEILKRSIVGSKQKQRNLIFKRIGVAATLLVLVGLAFKLYVEQDEMDNASERLEVSTENVGNVMEPGTTKAILTLGNGNQVALGQGKNYRFKGVYSNGEKITYLPDDIEDRPKEVIYNSVNVPIGGQFSLQLSDGTNVWLNAGSLLKYPASFLKNKPRVVELMRGEAYFEVSPSYKHNGMEFSVKTESHSITALGTEFNVSSYNEDQFLKTTLVEGSVRVSSKEMNRILKPSQQARTSKVTGKTEVLTVNVATEISWKDGIFNFKAISLEEIMNMLSRWYDAEVIFENSDKKEIEFSAVLKRTTPLLDILELIKISSNGDVEFIIDENMIYVK